VADRVKHSRVNIRKTHPALYHSIMTLSLMSVGLAANFWTSNPTFNPYGLSKDIVGLVFFVLGFSHLVFLNIFRDLRVVRIVLATSISWTCFWGASNTLQSFAGKASFQLPILYLALAILQVPLLIEAPVNPMTEKKQ
jgi:hypothetical protein